MATIKKKASQGEHNIIDLVDEIKRTKPRIESKEEIERLKRNIDINRRKNKRVSARISYLKKKIENSSPTDMKMLPYYEELDNFKRKGKASHADKSGIIITLAKQDIRYMVNELNRAQGKDFYYRINDGFNKRYNVKRSKILKMEDSSFFLRKFKDGVEDRISLLESLGDKTPKQKKTLLILKDKLLKTINFNSKLIEHENIDEKDLEKDFRERVDRAFSGEIDKEDKDGEYPILIVISGERVEF